MPPKVERGGEILTFARLRPVVESTPSRRVAYKIKRGSGSTRGYAAAEGDDAQKVSDVSEGSLSLLLFRIKRFQEFCVSSTSITWCASTLGTQQGAHICTFDMRPVEPMNPPLNKYAHCLGEKRLPPHAHVVESDNLPRKR